MSIAVAETFSSEAPSQLSPFFRALLRVLRNDYFDHVHFVLQRDVWAHSM